MQDIALTSPQILKATSSHPRKVPFRTFSPMIAASSPINSWTNHLTILPKTTMNHSRWTSSKTLWRKSTSKRFWIKMMPTTFNQFLFKLTKWHQLMISNQPQRSKTKRSRTRETKWETSTPTWWRSSSTQSWMKKLKSSGKNFWKFEGRSSQLENFMSKSKSLLPIADPWSKKNHPSRTSSTSWTSSKVQAKKEPSRWCFSNLWFGSSKEDTQFTSWPPTNANTRRNTWKERIYWDTFPQ